MIIANSGRVAVAGNVFCVFQATLGSVFSGPESGPACCGKTHSVTRKWARFLVTQSLSFFSERRLFFLVLEKDGLVSVRVACAETL